MNSNRKLSPSKWTANIPMEFIETKSNFQDLMTEFHLQFAATSVSFTEQIKIAMIQDKNDQKAIRGINHSRIVIDRWSDCPFRRTWMESKRSSCTP